MKKITLFSVFFCALLLLVAISHIFWIRGNNSIAGIDSQNHLLFSLNFFYAFQDICALENVSFFQKIVLMGKLLVCPVEQSCFYWPNTINAGAAICYSLVGVSLFAAKLSILFYLLVLLIATYLLGRFLYSSFVGLFGAFILFMYPMIFQGARQFQLDIPLTAMFALCFFLLLKTNYFRNTYYSIACGCIFGFSVLIKGQAVFFVGWSFAYMVFDIARVFMRKDVHYDMAKVQVRNVLLCLVCAGAIAMMWWFLHFKWALAGIFEHVFGYGKGIETTWGYRGKYSLDSLTFHFRGLFASMSNVFFTVFLMSIMPFCRSQTRYKRLVILSLVGPFVFFSTVFTIKHLRFLMPMMPLMAIISAWGIAAISQKYIRYAVIFIVVIVGLAQFYVLSYFDIGRRCAIVPAIRSIIGTRLSYEVEHMHNDEMQADKLVAAMRAYLPGQEAIRVLFFDICKQRPANYEFMYWVKMCDRFIKGFSLTEDFDDLYAEFDAIDFVCIQVPAGLPVQWVSDQAFLEKHDEMHAIRVRWHEARDMKQWETMLDRLALAQSDFRRIAEIPVFYDDTHQSCYYLYKRINRSEIENVA